MNPIRPFARALSVFAAALWAAAAADPQMPELLPRYWQENLSDVNGTLTRCLVFTTVPGVLYTVEYSNDLTHWTADNTIYGMGHDFATPMIGTTLVTAPSGGGGPPPAPVAAIRLVSLRLEPADDSAGGTVAAWRSLETQGALIYRIPETMAEEWQGVPLYAESFGAFYFFVAHSVGATTPPAENPCLTGADAAMIASLRDNLATMNQRVVASVIRARNTPPPPPADPNSRRFWRIRADWSLDTDRDGSLDWLEWRMAANPITFPVGGGAASADAFSRDSDNNQIPDGFQLDSDKDGVADFLDYAPVDPLFGAGDPVWRFAAFNLPEVKDGDGNTVPPRQINGGGIVLYPDSYWRNGAFTNLKIGTVGQVGPCFAMAINDRDNILGIGLAQHAAQAPGGGGGSNAATLPLVWAWWETPDSDPVPVEADGMFAEPTAAALTALQNPGAEPRFPFDSLLSSDGRFVGQRQVADGLDAGGTPKYKTEYSVWRRTETGFARDIFPALNQEGFRPTFAYHGNRVWGDAATGSRLLTGTEPCDFPYPVKRFAILNNHGTDYPVAFGDANTPRALIGGEWIPTKSLAGGRGASGDTGIRLHLGRLAGLSTVNGLAQGTRFNDLSAWAPEGIPHFVAVNHRNLAENGWLLTRPEAPGLGETAAMPVLLEDDAEATGVDTVSLCGNPWNPPVEGAQEKAWIMVPLGGPANAFRLLSRASADVRLTATAPGMKFGGGTDTVELNAGSVALTLATDDATLKSGDEVDLELSLGNGGEAGAKTPSASHPLAAYVMKQRTVRVNLYRVTKTTPDAADNPPDLAITDAAILAELNAVFQPQINATFEIAPAVLSFDWDANGNGKLDHFGNGDASVEQAGFATAVAAHWAGLQQPEPACHIRVFLLGTDTLINGTAQGDSLRVAPGSGPAPGAMNACWVVGDAVGGMTPEIAAWTVAHEIGHVLVGFEHPDEGGGRAPLKGTDLRRRLMCSGFWREPAISKILVKKEWDAAEEWLNATIKDDD